MSRWRGSRKQEVKKMKEEDVGYSDICIRDGEYQGTGAEKNASVRSQGGGGCIIFGDKDNI